MHHAALFFLIFFLAVTVLNKIQTSKSAENLIAGLNRFSLNSPPPNTNKINN